jgi:hypothetical protein
LVSSLVGQSNSDTKGGEGEFKEGYGLHSKEKKKKRKGKRRLSIF